MIKLDLAELGWSVFDSGWSNKPVIEFNKNLSHPLGIQMWMVIDIKPRISWKVSSVMYPRKLALSKCDFY